MEKLSEKAIENVEYIREKTGNSPDIIIKELSFFNTPIYIVMNETLADKTYIDNFVLKFFSNEKINVKCIKTNKNIAIVEYLEQNITTHKVTKIRETKDLFLNIFNGFSILIVDGFNEALSLETRAMLDSGVNEGKNEMVVKGPKDAFTENYQTNIGLIRKRIRSEDLWLEELVIGTKTKSKVGILYVKDVASKKIVDMVVEKIKNINIDGIFDSNYLIELISKNKRSVFPNYISTERPDQVCMHLLDGRITIMVENTQYVVVIPAIFADFFHTTEDFYQKVVSVNITRVIRLIALLIAILAPALYIAIVSYNFEAIPDKLLLSVVTQRTGIPLPVVIETLMMILAFEIIRETDSRLPNAIGSSLSIVGALILGQIAVSSGIVSPITIIVISVTSLAGMITYNMDVVGGVRWWRFVFLIFSSFFGLFGVLMAGFMFLISLTSIKSFGIPFLTPIAPFYKDIQTDALFLTNKRKFEKRFPLTSQKNMYRQGGK